MVSANGEMIVYRSDDGSSVVQLRAVDGTVWLNQTQIAELYGTSVPNVVQVIRRILLDGEVDQATINSELVVRSEGGRQVRREFKIYNLEMILAIGYRATTPRAMQFRQWATTVLKEYLVKGFALQDEKLKDPSADYFDELLARIRDIRASEQRFYQKVREIFAQTSADYDKASDVARTFYATIQNKLLFGVTGRTAAELVLARADPALPSMGLTSWKGAQVRKGDVSIAKNYLTADELDELNRLTTMFLDFAEDRARRRQQTLMADWVVQTDRFLTFNERSVLAGSGGVAAADMEDQVTDRYQLFDARRREQQSAAAHEQEEADLRRLYELDGGPRTPT